MSAQHPPRVVGDWQLEHEIGSGSFAVVWRARRVSTGELGAVKEINTDKLNKKLYESLASEVAVLNQTQHSNIVRLLDVFKDGNRIYIVLEFCTGGDLGNYIRRYGRVSESTARYFLLQLAEGLKELRKHNVIHRDLKPQNLLLSDTSATPLLKIADFGFARSLAPQGLAETLCGSPLYMAPEILQFHKYDAKADLWSIGTILFELLAGKPPFNGANHLQLLRNIERGEAVLPEHLAGRLGGACKGLLGGLLKRNPVERITFEEFFQHPFLMGPQGPIAGVPPPQPPAPVLHPAADLPDLPCPMRRVAAAAAAAAATGGPQGMRPAARPNLHVPPARPRHLPPQQQPDPLQHQQPPGGPRAAAARGGVGGWVPAPQQPVDRHPLQDPLGVLPPYPAAGTAAAGGGGMLRKPPSALHMSDSIEADYVVVCNPFKPEVPALGGRSMEGGSSRQGSLHQSGADQHSVSVASTGSRADSSAVMSAAVAALESPAVGGLLGLSSPGAAGHGGGGGGRGGEQRGVPPASLLHPMPAPAAAGDGGGGDSGVKGQQQQQQQLHQQQQGSQPQQQPDAAAAAAPPAAVRGTHSGLLQLQEQVNRVQLLAQLLRAVCEIMQQQAALADGLLPPEQQAEHVALRLYGVQLLRTLCSSPAPQQKGQQVVPAGAAGALPPPAAAAAGGGDGDPGAVSSSQVQQLVAAADAEDLQLLMEGGVQLLQLLAATAEQVAAGPLASSWLSQQQDQQQKHQQPTSGLPEEPAAVEPLAVVISDAALELPLPHPLQVLYQHALGSSRAAAVEELMGNWDASVSSYSLAADLLLFLALGWPELEGGGLAPCLGWEERRRVQGLYVAVNSRLLLCVQEQERLVSREG